MSERYPVGLSPENLAALEATGFELSDVVDSVIVTDALKPDQACRGPHYHDWPGFAGRWRRLLVWLGLRLPVELRK